MTDLIRKDAAIGALEERRDQYLPDSTTWLQIQLDIRAIAALPAVTVGVRKLVWEDFGDWGAKASAYYQANYLIQFWKGRGQFEVALSYPGYQTGFDGERWHSTIEAAKAAAQADYEARILATLEPVAAQYRHAGPSESAVYDRTGLPPVTLAAPDPAAITEALFSLPAVYAHQINTGVREVYDPLQRFYTMESVLAAITEATQ